MKMKHADITRYPKFAYYVKKNIPEIINVKAIVEAMQEIGQLNKATLKRAVQWESGPDINITPLNGAFGEFTPDIGSNEIRIDKSIVEDFEAGRGIRKTKSGKSVYLVGVTYYTNLFTGAMTKMV